ncbi:MAG TPA: hypothetical protein VN890_01630 [Methylocella sp.]|nr:hypothetical protein [Methylocella sp.]
MTISGLTPDRKSIDPMISPEISVDDCYFYHSMDIPGIGPVRGDWDLRGRFDEYTGHVPMAGKTVLDVGAASGFLSMEAEQRGAIVTSFDAEGSHQWQFLPNATGTEVFPLVFKKMRNSYLLAHLAFRSKARAIYGDIYKLSEVAPPADIVLVALVLVHLSNPLEVIHQTSLLAKERLIITEPSFAADQPLAVFAGTPPLTWWTFSNALYRQTLDMLGFRVIQESKSAYICNDPRMSPSVDLWTFVAERRPSRL